MNVLVDTSVWSLALRRTVASRHSSAQALEEFIRQGRAVLIGVVRQELLSGVRTEQQFAALRDRLRAFPEVVLETADFEDAAAFCNRCREKGIQGSSVDFLICAVAFRRNLLILTTDADFTLYAKHLPISLSRDDH